MSWWLVLRLVKWMGLLLLGYGVLGTALENGPARRQAALVALPAGMLAVMVAGFGLLELREGSIGELWVALSLVCGALAATGAALHASEARSRLGVAAAVGGISAAVGLMVFRDVGLAPGAVLGGLGAALGAAVATNDPSPEPSAVLQWFRWVGRCEGLSLLVLFGIAMPLKYGAGEPLLVAWVGWLHGVFFLLYAGGLVVGMSRLGFSLVDAALGLVAAMLPFGTLIFERRLER